MDIDSKLTPGRYVVAVSGGVDSVVLLHILRTIPGLGLTVAHFDHGIRSDSADDQRFVRDLAREYGLPYVFGEGKLGPTASEAVARQARYQFLHRVRTAADAQAVVTAHHQDDALETAILNIVRGTGRRGMTSLQSTDIVKRPLLHIPKVHIVRYAQDNQLLWHEDSTNASDAYKRNYVRHNLLTRFRPADREVLHDIIVDMRHGNAELDELLAQVVVSMSDDGRLHRHSLIMLPHTVAREVMAAWLRASGVAEIDTKMLERLVRAAKTYETGKRVDVTTQYVMEVGKAYLALERTER